MATFGITGISTINEFIFGADVVVAQSEYGTTMLFDNSVTLPNSKIFSAFISVLYAIALVIYMKKSRLGRAIRATAQNARAAKILVLIQKKFTLQLLELTQRYVKLQALWYQSTNSSSLCWPSLYSKIFYDCYCSWSWKFTSCSSFGNGLGLFEEFADYILGTEFRIGAVFVLVFILVYRRFKLSKKRSI